MSTTRPANLLRRARYALEGALVTLLWRGAGALSIDTASALGGALARRIGPLLPVNRRAIRNLERAFPDKSRRQIRAIVRGMWDNLGRTAAEYPHLHEMHCYAGDGRIEVVGAENIDLLRDDGKCGIFVSGHFANWEIASLSSTQRGLPVTQVYRAANNPVVDRLILEARSCIAGERFPKGASGGRQLVQTLRRGGHLAMLVDQRLSDGIPVPFFGRPAMTAPTPALLARKFDCPVVPARVERLAGARFRITLLAPVEVPRTDDPEADVVEGTRRINALFERWIRERPDQWLWLHRRWRGRLEDRA